MYISFFILPVKSCFWTFLNLLLKLCNKKNCLIYFLCIILFFFFKIQRFLFIFSVILIMFSLFVLFYSLCYFFLFGFQINVASYLISLVMNEWVINVINYNSNNKFKSSSTKIKQNFKL